MILRKYELPRYQVPRGPVLFTIWAVSAFPRIERIARNDGMAGYWLWVRDKGDGPLPLHYEPKTGVVSYPNCHEVHLWLVPDLYGSDLVLPPDAGSLVGAYPGVCGQWLVFSLRSEEDAARARREKRPGPSEPQKDRGADTAAASRPNGAARRQPDRLPGSAAPQRQGASGEGKR